MDELTNQPERIPHIHVRFEYKNEWLELQILKSQTDHWSTISDMVVQRGDAPAREDDVCLEKNILGSQKGAWSSIFKEKRREECIQEKEQKKIWIREIMQGQVRCRRTVMRQQTTLRDNSEQWSEQK